MTPSELYGLLYGFDEFFGQSARSVHPNDTPLLRVKLVPVSVGRELADLDPEHRHFNIEFYPDRAEVWASNAWDTSLTLRLRRAGVTYSAEQTPLEAQRSELEANLFRYLRSLHFTVNHARQLVEILLENPSHPQAISLIGFPPDLIDKLHDYRDHLSETTPGSNTASPDSGLQDQS